MPPSAGFPPDFFDRVSALVQRRAGLVFDASRRPACEAGLHAAMRRSGRGTPTNILNSSICGKCPGRSLG